MFEHAQFFKKSISKILCTKISKYEHFTDFLIDEDDFYFQLL